MWKWSSLHTAVRHVFHLRLAEAAGETRGSAGYALGALLHLMDAALSHAGDVYSNRKWYLLRWQRFLDSGAADGTPLAALGARFTELDRRLTDGLRGRAAGPLAAEFCAALEEVFAIAGEGHTPALLLQPAADVPKLTFLPGATLLVGRTALFLGADELPAGQVAVTRDTALPGDPAAVLGASRAGALNLLPA